MLCTTKDYQSTLLRNDRVYYSNYQYYNDLQQLSEYKNDLSKLRFNINRHTNTKIILYDTTSKYYAVQPTDRLIKDWSPPPTHPLHPSSKLSQNTPCVTLDDLIYHISMFYHQHNYSQNNKLSSHYTITILQFLIYQIKQKISLRQEFQFEQFLKAINTLISLTQKRIASIEEINSREHVETQQFMERWATFQLYHHYLLKSKLLADTKDQKIQNFYSFQFYQYFKYFLIQIRKNLMRSALYMTLPFTPTTSTSIHPLFLPLLGSNQENGPRILFLNLDGKQNLLNIRSAKALSQNVKYISVFRQPTGIQLTQTVIQQTDVGFQIDPDFTNMNLAHSQLLVRQASEQGNQQVRIFPLNSIYLRRLYSQMHQGEPLEKRRLPYIQSFLDLKWLWDEVIISQIQNFVPEIVFISYNGYLEIKQYDFNAIIKDLTILCDHKIVLFTNMTGMFKPPQQGMQQQNSQYQIQKIKLIQQFSQKYLPYNYAKINDQRYLQNLASFIKLSSGSISMKQQDAPYCGTANKFLLGRRKMYLQKLSQLPYFNNFLYCRGSQNYSQLFNNFLQRQLKLNKKQNQYIQGILQGQFQKLLKQDTQQFFEVDQQALQQIQKQQRMKEKVVKYRLHALKQQLAAEQYLIHGDGIQMDNYLQHQLSQAKYKILANNLSSYKYRKFYLNEEDQKQRIRCLRFCLEKGDQILLERYSQIINDQRKNRIFIINYRLGDHGHVILHGQIGQRGGVIKMRRVDNRLQKSIMDITLQDTDHVIRINYSWCFFSDKLILFWPQQWDIKQQVRKKLLGLQYNPPHINYMIQLTYDPQQRNYTMDTLKWVPSKMGGEVFPRRGCTACEHSPNTFIIFGGIRDNIQDYYLSNCHTNVAIVHQDTFQIATLPKKPNRYHRSSVLKPKMNYKLQKSSKSSQEVGSLSLSGGYGRHFTNYHSILSYQTYSLNLQQDGARLIKVDLKSYRIVKLSRPIPLSTLGRFQIGLFGQSQQRFSNQIKDVVIAESRQQKTGDKRITVVIDDQCRVKDFRQDYKKMYLLGWDRTIRQKIYLPYLSTTQLQFLSDSKLIYVQATLRPSDFNLHNLGKLYIPKQDQIISLCLEEDRLIILTNPSHDTIPQPFLLFEGRLTNMVQILGKGELSFEQRYSFKPQSSFIQTKSIFSLDQKLYLVGGSSSFGANIFTRQDLILEPIKDKYKIKIKRLQHPTLNLDLSFPYLLKDNDKYLLFSITKQINIIHNGEMQVEDWDWKFKVQTFGATQNTQKQNLMISYMQVYSFDYQSGLLVQLKPVFEQPKIVKICLYVKFSLGLFREQICKLYLQICKINREQLAPYILILQQMGGSDDTNLVNLITLHHYNNHSFGQLLSLIENWLNESKKQKQNIQFIPNSELITSLKLIYKLANKFIIQNILRPNTQEQLYKFLVQDTSSRKIKYVAIQTLATKQLKLLRVRYKHHLAVCLNQQNQEELYYNDNVQICEEIIKEKQISSTYVPSSTQIKIQSLQVQFKG